MTETATIPNEQGNGTSQEPDRGWQPEPDMEADLDKDQATDSVDQATDSVPREQPGLQSSRLMLNNPGSPPEALPDDIDLEELLACIAPGGHVTLHEQASGPMVAALLPYDDPRFKFYEAGVKQGRKEVVAQIARAGAGHARVTNHFAHVSGGHFHF
jgi:hypothetical protein